MIADNPTQVAKTLSVDNVQIVNGLQTSYSIFNHHQGGDDIRSVLVKVIINDDKETIDNIIASTNSQNPVSPALLRATDDVQREIELFFLNAGYFYDRRKNYYKNQSKPASRIFSIQTTAQSIESIIYSSPYSARSKPTTLIKDDNTYERIFNPRKSYQAYLNCCLILKKTNDHWGNISDTNQKAKISNFKLHLSRIAASFILNKASIDTGDIDSIDLDNYDVNNFNQSVSLLIDSIDTFQSHNPDANLINMAKTKGMTDQIIEKLNAKFL